MIRTRNNLLLVGALALSILTSISCNDSDTPSGGTTSIAGSHIRNACDLLTEQDVALALASQVDTSVSRKEFGFLFCQHSVNAFPAWSSIQLRTDYSLQEHGRGQGTQSARSFWDGLLSSYRNSKVRTVDDTSYYSQPSSTRELLIEEISRLGDGAFALHAGDSPAGFQLWVFRKYAVFVITTVPLDKSLSSAKSTSISLARLVVDRL